jgi:putative redox protein
MARIEPTESVMTITISRDLAHKMLHRAAVRQHTIALDEPAANGGEDLGVTPHELYDSALGACKALTVLWYAQRKQIPLQDIRVSVERDDSQERQGIYRLRTVLHLGGALSDAQRQELLAVAGKCPVHRLMTQATTEVVTELGAA